MTKQLIIGGSGAGNLKATPLNSLPKEAWTYFGGGSGKSGDILMRYKDVPWLKRGVDGRANTLSRLPYAILRSGDEIEPSSLPFRLTPMHLNQIEADLILYGCSYLFKGKNQFNRIPTLRRLHPTTMRPDYDNNGELRKFERSIQGQRMPIELDEVMYVWLPNRESETGPGTADAFSALLAAGLLHNADVFGGVFFEHGAIIPTIINIEGYESHPKAEQERVKSTFKRLWSGVKNAFSIIPVGGKVTATPLMQPLKDLVLPELTDKKREDIATALGVPQTLLFSNAANYATARQDDIHFYDKTIIPDAMLIEEPLNTQLYETFGLEFKFQPEKLEIYQALEAEKAEKLNGMLDRGVITINEYRDQMNMEPLEARIEVPALPDPPLPGPPHAGGGSQSEVEEVTPFKTALGKWRRMAVKRYKEGKPHKALTFETEDIPKTLQAAIRGTLKAIAEVDEVGGVFEAVLGWEGYP
jgi:HK97 family phage portal protein